jgi:hypothetical protein
MTTADFVLQLQRELDWRFDEIVSIKNLLTREPTAAARDNLRKSLVVVLYSHFEGFCVFALEHYVEEVNQVMLPCADAHPAIVAGAWDPVFNAMQHGDEKCRVFLKPLPNDAALHRHWRRRHFVEEIDRFRGRTVVLSEEVIDSESNLKPEVLQRNLFVVGLDHTFVEPHAATIHNLLGRRNRIAHGDDRRGVLEKEYDDYETAVFEICYKLIEFLEIAHRDKKYRK